MRYPDIHVAITERYPSVFHRKPDESYSVKNPDASRILERVQSTLKDGGVSNEEIDAYTREATSRCYNHLLFTTMTWVGTHWEGPDDATDEA